MPQTLTVTEAARHFANNLNRVAHQGEHFVLVQGNKPVAELYPLPTGKKPAELPALCASLPSLSEADAAQFADDLAASQKTLAQLEAHDPWHR